jgi:2'-5' RNA ligase
MSPILIPNSSDGSHWNGTPKVWFEDDGPPPRPSDPMIFLLYPSGLAARRMTQLASRLGYRYDLPGQPTDTNRIHVTLGLLCRFGRLTAGTLADIDKAVSGLAMPPFLVRLDLAKNFGREKGALVLCGDEGVTGITMLREELATAMRIIGFRKWSTRYEPHATLNYGRCAVPEQTVDAIEWSVKELVLVCSMQGRRRHQVLGRWSLRAPAHLH